MNKIILVLLIMASQMAMAQKYKSEKGSIKFYSEEILEDITAINNKARSVFDAETGNIVFSVTMRDFNFEKSLMKEHFNEKYIESEKYPKATFKGKVSGYETGKKNASVQAEGELTIHGISQPIKVTGSLEFKGNNIKLHSVFFVKLVDYHIKVPELMFQKIAEEIEVFVDFEYLPYE